MINNSRRLENSVKNLSNAMISQGISLILNFLVRTVFVIYLNEEYLGTNGLFSNILSILSLAELGFGTAMVYNMYKPLVNNDQRKIKALMKLYAKVYTIIGIIVAIIGIGLMPFLDYIIKDTSGIENLKFIYLIFLIDCVCSYFFAYKRSILTADQKEFICSQYKYIFTIVKSVLQIITLVIFKNFILYLLIQILFTLLENIFISIKVNNIYPFLKEKNNEKLSKNELMLIKNDVKALVLTKLGHVMLTGTDNIIISTFIGIGVVGILSNYNLIINSVVMVISQIMTSLTGSIGNYIASNNKRNNELLFKRVEFVNFWIYSFCMICLIFLLNPFIKLWIGEKYILNQVNVIVLSINFLISGIMSTLWTFRSTIGLFTQGKYRPIFAAILNIVISVILAKSIGVVGVLLGTIISRLLVNLWYDPYIIYKFGFDKSVKSYYLRNIFRISLVMFMIFFINYIQVFILCNNILIKFFILIFLCISIPTIIFLIVYRNTDEFKYLKGIINNITKKIAKKLILN